jgi:lysophospholipase L1-like esterase
MTARTSRGPVARRSPLVLLALAGLLLALLSPPVTAPARAAAPAYVALGDSYSSGTGTRSYLADGTACQRSTSAYPSLIAAARGYALNLRACSGATIPDVTDAQLGALSGSTSYVTISVGGNDAGFADVLTECALPWWASNCGRAIDTAQSFIKNTLPGRLSTLYAAIRAKAPNAKVVVVGYPRIFMGEDCNAFTWFSPANRFVGHAVCDDVEWINGLSSPISESYHPNKAGHASGYTPTVSPGLTGATVAATTRLRREAARAGDDQAALQRQYADRDAAIEPKVFTAPDLTTRHARRMARRAGVDLERFLARSGR